MVARRGRVGARRGRRPLCAPGRLRRRHHARTPERRLLPRPVRRSLPAPGRGPLGPAGDAGDRLGAGDRGAGLPARRRRRVRVRRAALERQGDLRQRGPHLLPRQLAVLGPEHPRPLPGGDDDRAGGDRRLRTAPERGPGRGGVLRAVPRPARRQLLADEHPGAARGPARPRRRPLGARPRDRRRRRDARRPRRGGGPDRRRRAEQRDDERPRRPDRRRPRDRPGPSRGRARLGRVRRRVHGPLLRGGGVRRREPHRAGHRRRRAGHRRPARLRGRCSSSASGRCCRRPGSSSASGPAGPRSPRPCSPSTR